MAKHGEYTLDVSQIQLEAGARFALQDSGPIVKEAAEEFQVYARSLAPIYTGRPRKNVIPGALRAGIVVRQWPERTAKPGKVVYDVYMDPKMNEVFAKYSKAGKRYYYPASQEYGFRKVGGGRVHGKYFMRTAAKGYAGIFEQKVKDSITKKFTNMRWGDTL
jgi:hypothetical protein